MSLLADWFFTTTMRLSPADAHAFLDTMAVLRSPSATATQRRTAATALRSASPWIQAYALRPLLAATQVRTEHGTDDILADSESDDVDAELVGLTEAIVTSVLSLTDHRLAGVLGTAVSRVARGDPEARNVLIQEVAAHLAAEHEVSRGRVWRMPYHDLSDHIMPTVAVIALCELTRRSSGTGDEDWLGDSAVPLAAAALRGDFGRLALLAAAEGAGRADPQTRDSVWRSIWRAGRGAAHLQPDLLDALARCWHGHPDGDEPPTVQTLETEAVTGATLSWWMSRTAVDNDSAAEMYSMLTGRAEGSPKALSALIWHATVWGLAAEVDRPETIARLARWWQIPTRPPWKIRATLHAGADAGSARAHVDAILSVRPNSRALIDDNPIVETTAEDGSSIFSPWLSRWHDGWDHGRRTGPAFREGPTEQLFRLLTAAPLAVLLLQDIAEDDEEYDHITSLLFHACDVIRDEAALLEQVEHGEYIGEHPLGPALVALLWHVHLVVHDAGVGRDERVRPAVLADFALRLLNDDSAHDLARYEQRARLARQSLGAICTIWITRAWVESTSSDDTVGPGRWFVGDPPRALRLLFAALDRLAVVDQERKRLRQSGRKPPGLWLPDLLTPAQALREIYPQSWPEPVRDRWGERLDIDWYKQRDGLRHAYNNLVKQEGGDRNAVSSNAARPDRLLLSPPHPVEIWREHAEDLDNWSRVQAAPMTMRVLRMTALLHAPATPFGDPVYDEWIEEWLDRLHAVDHSTKLPLSVRTLMIALIEPQNDLNLTEPAHLRRLEAIHAATIDAILEFGDGNLRHVELLLDRLAARLPLHEVGADRLRLRAVETIYRRRRFATVRPGMRSASDLDRQQRHQQQMELVLCRFLTGTSARTSTPEPDLVPIAERVRQAWEDNQAATMLRAAPITLGERRKLARDGRDMSTELRMAATTFDQYRGREIRFLLDVQTTTVSDGERPEHVRNLFQNVKERKNLPAHTGTRTVTVLGVVAAVESDHRPNQAAQRSIRINGGTGALLTWSGIPATGDVIDGEVIGVQLHGDPISVVGLRALGRATPTSDEIRYATVRTTAPWLEVRVDGVDRNSYPAEDSRRAEMVRRHWDPDLARTFIEPTETIERRCPVRWDAALRHWVPVIRRLSELIVSDLSNSDSVTLTYTCLDEQTDTPWFFVSSPGLLYYLPPEVWADPDPLLDLLGPDRHGAVVDATLVGAEYPRLAVRLDGDAIAAHDNRNILWARYFDDYEDELVAIRDESGRHIIEIDPPQGFPTALRALGAEDQASRVHVVALPWSDCLARLAEVRVNALTDRSVPDPEQPTRARFDEMYNIHRGDVVVLDKIVANHLRKMWATTSTGRVVGLESESVTLLNTQKMQASGLVRGRPAEVVSDPQRDTGRVYPQGPPISDAHLALRVHTAGADAATAQAVISAVNTVDGVIVRRLEDGRRYRYGTWCRFGATVHYVELEPEYFGVDDPKGVGHIFTGTRIGEDWVLRLVDRRVTVRALFEVRDADPETDAHAMYVGSDQEYDYRQLPHSPVLLRSPAHAAGEAGVRELDLHRADIQLVDPKSKYSIRTITVRNRKTGFTILGSTTEPRVTPGLSLAGIQLRLTSRTRPGGDRYYQARRTFELRRDVSRHPAKQQTDHSEQWRQFLASGEEHVVGALDHDETSIEIIGGLHPPGPDGVPTARLPLAPGQQPAVAGVRYRKNNVRARLVPTELGYAGSYADAAPFSVAKFARRYRQVALGVRTRLTESLHYVGPPTDALDAHLFEWGYGWRVAVPPERLRISGIDNSPPPPSTTDRPALPALFHGDRVVAVTFAPAEDGGGPTIVIDRRDIIHRYVRRVVDESGRGYLHLIDLEIRMDTGSVRVLRARASRSLGDPLEPFQGAQWVPFAAMLDPDSRDSVLDNLRLAGETGLVHKQVLARLDFGQASNTGGLTRTFHAVRFGDEQIRDNDYIFLTARRIDLTNNELTVIFGLPDTLSTNDVEIRVNRREFSYRESTLARLIANGLDVEQMDVIMLVKVLRARTGVRNGSVLNAPTRAPETLVSYLASRGGICYAIMGDNRLEIAPGVLYSASGTLGAQGIRRGAVVRLDLDNDRQVRITTAVPADESYISGKGRPAIVFPKTPVLRKPPADDAGMRRMFTVAGLPDVVLSPLTGSGAKLLGTPHPKACVVFRDGVRDFLADATNSEKVRLGKVAGREVAEPAQIRRWQPGGRRAAGEPEVVEVPWARMSFTDTTAHNILAACRHNQWTYHDRKTGHVSGGKLVGPYPLGTASATQEGVFFDSTVGWTLRYPPRRLLEYGLPASALVEDRTLWSGERGTFTVAGPNADNTGLWLEMGPGRVIEVRGALVTTGEQSSLAMLDWSLFGPGDRVELRLSHRSSGQDWEVGPNHLMLVSWRTTVRNALPKDDPKARLLLPVSGSDSRKGALYLGVRNRIVYPMALNDLPAYAAVDAVWVDQRNDIAPAGYDTLRPGDVALLVIDDQGQLRLSGLPEVEVRLASRSEAAWPGYEWLRRCLEDPATRRSLLDGLRGPLAVTVDLVGLERPVVTVSRRQQRTGRWPANRLVRSEIVATLGSGMLMLYSGGAAFTAHIGDVVAGVPASLREQVAKTLTDPANRIPPVLWWNVDNDGKPHPGIAPANTSDPLVVAEYAVADAAGQAAGVICRDVHTERLYWLPAQHASWIPGLPANTLLRNLRSLGRLATRARQNGAVSITTHPAVVKQVQLLRPSAPLRVSVGTGEPTATRTGRWRYVARLEMPPVLLAYESREPDLTEGTSRLAEVDEVSAHGQPSVTVLDVNTRLVRLDLPRWLIDSHSAILEDRPGATGTAEGFDTYRRWYREGVVDDRVPDDAAEAIIRAAGTIVEHAADPDYHHLSRLAEHWLATDGAAAFNLLPDREFDAAVLLSAVVTVDFLGRRDQRMAAAAVAALHQLGRRALASMHTEQFATAWITRPERHGLNGTWARLRSLSLAPELTQRQVRQLRSFCQAMLVKPSLRSTETDLEPLSRSLLTAIGELDSATDLLRDAGVIAPLAIWGRTLIAPLGHPTAQDRLLDSQRENLHTRTDHLVGDALPITLLPTVAPPRPDETQLLQELITARLNYRPTRKDG
ncbi:hypothetical protein [Nocardia sp. NPDC050710]|uniref:hypothetical protein n=1 Tax=Nocardia sp. NPDC050710 TaxID=3157220 RepID=UPI0033FDA449